MCLDHVGLARLVEHMQLRFECELAAATRKVETTLVKMASNRPLIQVLRAHVTRVGTAIDFGNLDDVARNELL